MSFLFFWKIKSSWEAWRSLVPNQRCYHGQHDFFNMAHRSKIWIFIDWTCWTIGHPCLQSNHQRVQVWIRHQKFCKEIHKEKSYIFPWWVRLNFEHEKKCCRKNILNFRDNNLFVSLHFPGIHIIRLPKIRKMLY